MKGLIWQDDENIIDVVYQTIYCLPIKEAIHVVYLYQEKQLIPVDWIKSRKATNVHEKYDYVRGCFDGFNDCIDYLISEWEKENEISTMPASDNSTIPLDYLGERK